MADDDDDINFQLTEKGIKEAERLLATDPDCAMLWIKLAHASGDTKRFYDTLEYIINLKVEVDK